jgi:hypothetical protein
MADRTPPRAEIGIRWTIGDVSERGFQALHLSILGARRLFGPDAAYGVTVNSLPIGEACARVGAAAEYVCWHASEPSFPAAILDRLDPNLAEGVAWKFSPLRLYPDRYEIALDNDCILWRMPAAIRESLAKPPGQAACVLAEDVAAYFGWFAPLCGAAPRNTGIRGLPAGFDLESALDRALARLPGAPLSGEADEQGLQVAALSADRPPLVVTLDEVAICSPFPPHRQRPGSCGAHFVGLNMRKPRPQHGVGPEKLDQIACFWDALRPTIEKAICDSDPAGIEIPHG